MSVLRILIKRNRKWVIISVVLTLVANLTQMIYMYYVGELVNKIEERAAVSMAFIVLLAGFIILSVATLFMNQYVGRITAEKMAHTLRMGYASKLLHRLTERGIECDTVTDRGKGNDKAAAERGKQCDTASVMSVVQNELVQSDGYLTNAFFDITGMLFMGILATVFMFIQNVILTLVLLIPTLIILIYVGFSSRSLSKIVSAAQNEKMKMNKAGYAAVHAFPAVKTFEGEELCKKAMDERLVSWTKYQTKVGRYSALYNTLSGILSRVPLMLLLLAGGYMVIKGKILMGTLILFLNLQNSLTQSIMNLPNWIAGFKVFTTNLSRIEIE
ncbi:MAG: ABC transporter ATP-binding protein [Eubacterium sp.]|nr:ABC transporter ATP-binding protein [Eubacterium sp.]